MRKTWFLTLLCLQILSAQEVSLPVDTQVKTSGQVTIKGKPIPYHVTAGTQPVWDAGGKVIASLFYTYYERSDIRDQSPRPLLISFNGGPGSASVWMHIAYTGPKVLQIDSEGYPIQPYGIQDNPFSVLDVADIVFVDPVNTGYSRIIDKETKPAVFFGVNADIRYLADWVSAFVKRKNRWLSPKFLIGESYGTTRVSGLSLELQNSQWMYLNGVILVSPTNLGILREGPVDAATRLPYYAATAWFHKLLKPELQGKDLADFLPQVEDFALEELLPALARGGYLSEDRKLKVAQQYAEFSGLDVSSVLENNLDVSPSFFWKNLRRHHGGFTVGRLDSRYLGIDRRLAGQAPDYNAEITSWLHSFTPAINYYIQEMLQFKTDLRYNMFGPVSPWDRSGDKTGENLRQAMAQNPYLQVMVQSGYYDGATNYFDAKYSMWNLDPSGRFQNRLRFEGYRSGHMMYLRREDLEKSNDHLRDFILKALPSKGSPAKY